MASATARRPVKTVKAVQGGELAPALPFLVFYAQNLRSRILDRHKPLRVATDESFPMRERIREPIFNIPRGVVLLLAGGLDPGPCGSASGCRRRPNSISSRNTAFIPARFGFLLDQRAVLDHLTKVATGSAECRARSGSFSSPTGRPAGCG